MQTDRWLECRLYDRNRKRVGTIGDYVSLSVTDGWLRSGTGTLVVKATQRLLPEMLEPGSRVVVGVKTGGTDTALPAETVLSGRLIAPQGGFLAKDNITFTIKDDWTILTNTLARVVPSGDITPTSFTDFAQTRWDGVTTLVPGTIAGLLGRYAWPSGGIPASTAVYQLLLDNLISRWSARFGEVFRLSDPGMGADVSSVLPSVRFDTLENYVVPLLQSGGIGLKVWQNELVEPFIDIDFVLQKTWPAILTPDSGIVTGGTWSISDTTATDVTVGGPGEEAARAFRQFQDLDAADALQQLVEVFRDDTGAPMPWPDGLDDSLQVAAYYHLRPEVLAANLTAFENHLAAAAADVLSDGASASGLTVTLSEGKAFRWGGDGYHTGDIVTVGPSRRSKLANKAKFTSPITQTTFSQSSDNGLVISPQVGDRSDDPDVLVANAIKALARANNRRATNF